jgi:hypothetical protein
MLAMEHCSTCGFGLRDDGRLAWHVRDDIVTEKLRLSSENGCIACQMFREGIEHCVTGSALSGKGCLTFPHGEWSRPQWITEDDCEIQLDFFLLKGK